MDRINSSVNLWLSKFLQKHRSLIPSFKVGNKLTAVLFVGILVIIGAALAYLFLPEGVTSECENKANSKNLPVISKQELANHDGIKAPTIFVGYHCLVYDVSLGRDKYYGDGKPYHYLVGRDSTKQLSIFGGSMIEDKYKAVGILGD